jgi:hypothetical protein
MDGRQLYTTILGLTEPWVVEEVEVAADAEEVRVRLTKRDGTELECPGRDDGLPALGDAAAPHVDDHRLELGKGPWTTVDPAVLLPDPLDLRRQRCIAP